MNCQDVRAALLGGETSEAISSHLETCVACRRSIEEIETIRSGLGSDSIWAEPAADLEDAVVEAIMGSDRPDTGRSSSAIDAGGRRFGPRPVTLILGSVAAALVLIVGALSLVSRTPESDWEAAMIGTELSPVATGVVSGWNTDSGTRLLLEVSELGVAPEGSVYQLWFSKGSTNVSAGTFTNPSRVELTVGVARKDYPNVWIALQEIDVGEPGPALLHTTDS